MYCRNCGRKIEDGKEFCTECEANKNTEVINEEQKQEVVQEVVATQTNPIVEDVEKDNNSTSNEEINDSQTQKEAKSKIAAGLFGIFLGAFGVHNFYLGFTGKAVAQLLITILSCGCLSFVSGIWGLVEGILILTGEQSKDANGNSLKD